ncbi:hypothetical protein BGZ52_003845 [Haplosporangium bisporale]|nr:hypothetical protein BGZ52_003845 [Haplosporangium bisporale]
MSTGAIPIYLGAADVADFIPEGRFYEDFDDLIDYINTVVKKDHPKLCKSCFKVEEEPWCIVVKKVNFV